MLAELIERLEKAAGPDRVLDSKIEVAIGRAQTDPTEVMTAMGGYVGRGGEFWGYAPNYTSSLDAALTLVPEGWYWSGDSRGCAVVGSEEPPSDGRYGFARGHNSPAIALCIAALKARGAKP